VKDYHEPVEELSPQTRQLTQALSSLKEEVEAVDWYTQRIDATDNDSLKSILEHNRDEEVEHACMTIEWLRRNMPVWDKELRNYLFLEGEIINHEDGATESTVDLGIGNLEKE
jgi:uncharacterized protein